MQNKLVNITYAWLGAILLSILSSCTKERAIDCLHEGSINIALNMEGTTQRTMKFYFFPETGAPIVREGTSTGGYSGTLPEGKYSVLIFNDDDKSVFFNGLDSFSTAECHAIQTSKSSSDIILQPEAIYGESIQQIEISKSSTIQQNLTPKSYLKSLTLNFNMAGQSDQVSSCVASIGGIAQGVNLTSREIIISQDGGHTVSTSDISTTNYSSTITLFGQDPATPNILTTEISFTSGAKQIVTVDVTEAIQNINDPTAPEIEITPEITINKDINGNFSATLTSWSYKDETIIIKP